MTKLLFFINSLGAGGAEKVLVNLVNLLPEEKYDISVKVLFGGVHSAELKKQIHYKEIIKTKNPYIRRLLMFYYVKLMNPRKFYDRFLKADYDVECAYLEGFNTKILANSTNEKSKKNAFVHTNFETLYGLEGIYGDEKSAKKIYASYDKIVFVSQAAYQGFEKKFGAIPNGVVIHNIMDSDAIRRAAQAPCSNLFSSEKINLVSVGRLERVKGYERLLKALARLKAEGIAFHLILLGDGTERKTLESFAKEHDLDVDFLGFQNNPYPYIAKSDLFVCPSRSEGYSTAVTESVLLCTPVLTTDCAGMDEILDNGTYGMVVENSTDGIVDGLRQIAEDEKVLTGLREKAAQRQDFFSTEKNLATYEALFR